jgi:hypothetical protein
MTFLWVRLPGVSAVVGPLTTALEVREVPIIVKPRVAVPPKFVFDLAHATPIVVKMAEKGNRKALEAASYAIMLDVGLAALRVRGLSGDQICRKSSREGSVNGLFAWAVDTGRPELMTESVRRGDARTALNRALCLGAQEMFLEAVRFGDATAMQVSAIWTSRNIEVCRKICIAYRRHFGVSLVDLIWRIAEMRAAGDAAATACLDECAKFKSLRGAIGRFIAAHAPISPLFKFYLMWENMSRTRPAEQLAILDELIARGVRDAEMGRGVVLCLSSRGREAAEAFDRVARVSPESVDVAVEVLIRHHMRVGDQLLSRGLMCSWRAVALLASRAGRESAKKATLFLRRLGRFPRPLVGDAKDIVALIEDRRVALRFARSMWASVPAIDRWLADGFDGLVGFRERCVCALLGHQQESLVAANPLRT